VDVAIYAHGGLTSEDGAAATAAKWIPALYDSKIFPIFFMWETDLLSTLGDRLEDVLKGEPRMAGGLLDVAKKWWNERLEKLLARPGTTIWGEMKQNGAAISQAKDSGSIVHSYLVKRLCGLGWTFESVNFMAPAVRVDAFMECVAPALRTGKVKRLNQFHLADDVEQKDPTCKPILGYSRSLLYLVSQSFEDGVKTPILGMQRYFEAVKNVPNVRAWAAPGPQSKSTTHGGFDDDATTMASVIALIKGANI
jgi:hypothetical protein